MTAPSLTEFLLARLAEDEAAAMATDSPHEPWSTAVVNGKTVVHQERDVLSDGRTAAIAASLGAKGMAKRVAATAGWLAAEHIARHDPARVLADVESKRRIVEEHTNPHGYGYCPTCYDWEYGEPKPKECPTLRLLALPYGDHPDYQEAWKL